MAVLVVSALIVTAVPGPVSAEETPLAETEHKDAAPKAVDSDGDGVPDRPDSVSAGATARAIDESVEDLSQRTEASKTFVNPDGTSTLETSAGIQRLRGEDGDWQDVDLDLVEGADGSFSPKVAPSDVTIGGGGSKLAATVNLDEDQALSVTWPETLPEPDIDGGVATYELSETTDLLVIATKTGVAAHIRLNEPPAEDDPALTMGLKTENLSLDTTAKGELEVTDSRDKKVATTAPMKAWDAKVDAGGDPINVVPVTPTLDEVSSNGDVARSELTLEPEAGFLQDPETVYPVIVDPDISRVTLTSDTMVRNGITDPKGTDARLWVGRLQEATSTDQWLTYVKWNNAQLAGKTILSASAKLWQYMSTACGRQMNARALSADLTAGTVFSNRPGVISTYGSSTTNGPCLNTGGWVTTNLRNMAQAWAAGSTPNYGVQFSVPSEYATNYNYSRRFCSANESAAVSYCNTAAKNPVLSITYNSPPAVPAVASVEGATSNGGTFYSRTNKPKISAKLTDPEGTTVRSRIRVLQGSTVKQDIYSAFVASGGTATKELAALADGSYTVQVWSNDNQYDSASYKSLPLVVDTVAPPTPEVYCDGGVTSGQWYETRPTDSTTCTVFSFGAKAIAWNRNNQPQTALVTNGVGTAVTPALGVPNDGVLSLAFTATDIAGNRSAPGLFGFGTGAGATITPVQGERTSSTTLVTAEGPDGATGARIEYRAPGDDTAAWTPASQVKVGGSTWDGSITTTVFGTSATPPLVWDLGKEPGVAGPAVRDMRVCFVFDGISKCTPSRQVTLVPAAFGSSFPNETFGPGTLALSTGEFSIDQTDVQVPVFGGELTLGRSHRSFAGASTPASSVFGPGWVADLGGPEAGVASMEVIDNTTQEAAITLVSPDGSSATYVNEDDQASPQRVGYYIGDAETSTDNDYLELYMDGGTKYLSLLDEDGTETIWKHLSAGTWVIAEVDEPFENGTTQYHHNNAGLVDAIYSAAPEGESCSPTAQSDGCRVLELTYNTDGLLTKVDLKAFDPKPGNDGLPGTGAIETVTIAEYSYTGGLLTSVRDPRLGPSIVTEYEYSQIGTKTVVTKITEPGLTPWRFTHATTGANAGQLTTVKRAQTAGGGDATWTVDYTTALHGSGLPDVRPDPAAEWGQTNAPVAAATVFGPDAPSSPSPSDGTISYWDTEGRTTNTATYGAGDWQLDTTTYDAKGNVVWALDEGNRNTALASSDDPVTRAETANTLAVITTYNSDGTRVETSKGPTREVMLKNGDQIAARDYSETVYDDEAADESVPANGRPTPAPDAPALNLPVEVRSGVIDANGTTFDISRTRYRYDPIESGDGDGWTTGQATQVLTELGSGWSTTQTRHNSDGQLIAELTPQAVASSGNERAVRTRITTYYTSGPEAHVAACRDKPEWAGLVCQTGPAAQPTTGKPVPIETTAGYDYLQNPTRFVEASGSMARVNVSGYDSAGRKIKSSTEVTGATAGDQPIADTTYAYSATTGLPTTVSDETNTQTTGYDAWGRVTSQTDGAGNTATSTYDTAGRVKTKTNAKGTFTYTYNGTDAAGKVEKRGLVTKLDVDLASGPDEITAAYDGDGNGYLTVYPGGVKAVRSYDPVGTETALAWSDANNIDLAAFSQIVDSDGKVRVASSPGSWQTYTYDERDRLTKVQDTTEAGCVTREYAFSLDSNRESLTTTGPDASGGCTTSGGSTVTTGFDSADRLSGGTVYDELGRTRTELAAHTDRPSGSNLTVAYYANDMVASLKQHVNSVAKSKDYELDASGRIGRISDSIDGVEVRQVVNHYDDQGDSPAWATVQSRDDASGAWSSGWQRNIPGPDGLLAMVESNEGATLLIPNQRGDVVGRVDVATATQGLTSYSEATEYGLARDQNVVLPDNYGWLGTKQRSTDTVGGLTLMGARLYNPVTGRFLSRDPVRGGNDNAYTYPADPINKADIDGKASLKKKIKKFLKKQLKKLERGIKKGWNSKAWKRAAKLVAGTWLGEKAIKYCGYVPHAATFLCSLLGFAATWRHKGKAAAQKFARDEIVGKIGAGGFYRALTKLAGGKSTKLAKKLFEMSATLHWDALDTVIRNAGD